jgi:hypothetical protein
MRSPWFRGQERSIKIKGYRSLALAYRTRKKRLPTMSRRRSFPGLSVLMKGTGLPGSMELPSVQV